MLLRVLLVLLVLKLSILRKIFGPRVHHEKIWFSVDKAKKLESATFYGFTEKLSASITRGENSTFGQNLK